MRVVSRTAIRFDLKCSVIHCDTGNTDLVIFPAQVQLPKFKVFADTEILRKNSLVGRFFLFRARN